MTIEKLKFIFWVVVGCGMFLLFMTILMPLFSDLSSDAAAEVAASSYNATYVGSQEAINYMPMVLYIFAPIGSVVLIVWRLKRP